LAKNALNISPPRVPTACKASLFASCSSRTAASGCGAGPPTTFAPAAGSYSLCSEQQWMVLERMIREAVDDSR
jgi:hypothetical protein